MLFLELFTLSNKTNFRKKHWAEIDYVDNIFLNNLFHHIESTCLSTYREKSSVNGLSTKMLLKTINACFNTV